MTSVIEPPALDDALAEAKALLRIDGGAEDAVLARLIADAAALGEAFTGQWLLPREGSELIEACSRWQRLKATPVKAILGVDALPEAGDPVPLAADAYGIDIDANGDGWVRVHDAGGAGRVKVRFEAGLASSPAWPDLPETLRHGMLRLAAHHYTHRDDERAAEPPAAVTALWRPWRRMRLQ